MKYLSGYYQASGNGWYLAKSLQILASEIATKYPQATCLGTVGDITHQDEGYGSDHNPFVIGQNGQGVVRAIDIGGPNDMLKEIRQFLWSRYAAQDSRVYQFGYMKGCDDNLINNWGLPFDTHVDEGDAGHLHISVTQKDGNNPSPSGYVTAIDTTGPWGLSTPTPTNPPASLPGYEEEDMFMATLAGHGTILVSGSRAANIVDNDFKTAMMNDKVANYPVSQKQWDELEARFMHQSNV